MLIHAKGRQEAQMPMPPDVGAVIVAYLRRDRPVSSCRRLFIRALAPHVGFASGCAITMIAKMALKRAAISGCAHQGAHLFRHSVAPELLRSGATLSQIGQLPRHQNHDTTRIYARVDIAALRTLGLPWPGLIKQRNASRHTIACYSDTFRLLLKFAQAKPRKPPSALTLDDLDTPFISAFLADLETARSASVWTRNLRLTAIRSFFRFLSFEEPA
jgi:site-specific recombinase XerD